MSTITFKLQIGDVVKTLTVIESRAKDTTDLMKDVLLLMLRSTQINFEVEGRPRWAGLAQSTERQRFPRAAKSKGGKKLGSLGALGSLRILWNTGQLAQSTGSGASAAFSTATGSGESDRTTATITTRNPGAWNQFPNTRTGAPAREFFVWQEQDAEDFLASAADYLMAVGAYAA